MKRILLSSLFVLVQGCSSYSTESVNVTEQTCIGSVELPQELALQFTPVQDEALLSEALGEPLRGKLCQGKVYQSKKDTQVVIYRAWNSTNPNSKLGQWWSFVQPVGRISEYREDYEICYQWSPLDKMVKCTLKPETNVIVGNGQSATCSEYLKYKISEKQQVYIADTSNTVVGCEEYNGVMAWE